jgi:lysozyme
MKRLFIISGLIISMIVVAFAFLFYKQGFYKKVVATNDKKEFIWGIDISHHQKNIDYDRLISENKPAYVYLKTSQGKFMVDDQYSARLKKFRELGIPVGGYHFFNYNVSGKDQAAHYIKTADLQKGDLYPVLDVEMKHSSSQNKQWIVKEIKSFCEVVKEEYGVEPLIYCEYDYYRKYLKEDFSDYQYWISDFVRAPRCNYVMWQYDTLPVKGLGRGKIDNNRLAEGVKLEQLILK